MDKKFQTFTGSSRRPRQVNLSGRNNNPFAAVSGASTSRTPLTTHDAVAHAQQERRARQQERDRVQAVKTLQRIWRGYTTRREFRSRYRLEWDFREGITSSAIVIEEKPYAPPSQALEQLRLLVRFASPSNQHDIQRMQRFATRCCKAHGTLPWKSTANNAGDWTYPLLFAAKICLVMLQKMYATLQVNVLDDILLFLSEISKAIPGPLSLYSHVYFKTLSLIARHKFPLELIRSSRRGIVHINNALLALLETDNPAVIGAYEGFVNEFLTTPDLDGCVSLKVLADRLNTRILTTTYKNLLMREPGPTLVETKTTEELSWLLAYFIYLRRMAPTGVIPRTPDADFVLIVSRLITHLPRDVLSRIDTAGSTSVGSLPLFIATELSTLVTQAGVQSLLRSLELNSTPETSHQKASSEAAALASYALTLLQFFPRRGDEIRMWLFQGTASRRKSLSHGNEVRVPAIKYFWEAVTRTDIFRLISDHPQNVLGLLTKANVPKNPSDGTSSRSSTTWEQEWRIIFLFFELYTFVLKVMDDEEFVNGSDSIEENQSWTRRSALTLAQVRDLTIFLKHLAYSMYWDAAKLIGAEDPIATTSLADYFGNTSVVSKITSTSGSVGKVVDADIAGVTGMRLTYVRGMVTGLLRMIYERDSRRKFMPEGHWLMTDYFDMRGFIPAVVSEEAYKHQNQDAEDDDDDIMEIDSDTGDSDEEALVGTHRTQQVRRIERLKRQQRKTARRKQLGAVTPRLEILQNMPFFIPFATRVEIFHQFVHLDQFQRRDGFVDPELWRLRMTRSARMNGPSREEIGKHSAKIRRDHCFEDAFDQFYDLGESLKEPIQISFVDSFGTEEAGIDGGGVTKEFLTSVTSEAFTPSPGSSGNLFAENDQHLLYPNPAAMDERRAYLKHLNFEEGSLEWNEAIRDLLKHYEFLGRIVGKCLYEGILIDVQFAPFFLVKWALSGGSNGAATNESGYRASVNDLRDLDEELYQGLLKLKNYPGNVEDFSLDFTITDTIMVPAPDDIVDGQLVERNITRELRKNGSQIPVTNENRLVYISYVARHRLQVQPHQQTNAFLRGLSTMIQSSWLSMFNQSELQTLIGGGSSQIDVNDLRRNTTYGGLYVIGDDREEHPTVKMFWKVMEEFSDQDRRKLLKYVTSTPRAPILGFRRLNPPFSIRDSGNDQSRLPSTSTCVNLLKLPVYKSEKLLKEKLQYAINAGAGFDLS